MVADKPRFVVALEHLIRVEARVHSVEKVTADLVEAANWLFWSHLDDSTQTHLGKKFLESCKDINDRIIAAEVNDVIEGDH